MQTNSIKDAACFPFSYFIFHNENVSKQTSSDSWNKMNQIYKTDIMHTLQCPSTKIKWGRLGKPVTLEETYALYQSVTVWNRLAYSKRVTRSVGSSIHCKKKPRVKST